MYRNMEAHRSSCHEWAGCITKRPPDRGLAVNAGFHPPYWDGKVHVLGEDGCIRLSATGRELEWDLKTISNWGFSQIVVNG